MTTHVGRLAAAAGCAAALMFAGCGDDDDAPAAAPPAKETSGAQTQTSAGKVRPAGDDARFTGACVRPSGQVLGAVGFAVRGGSDRDLAGPAAETQNGQSHYVAVKLTGAQNLVALFFYRDDSAYLQGLRALNGTAKTHSDARAAPGTDIPRTGQDALDCVT